MKGFGYGPQAGDACGSGRSWLVWVASCQFGWLVVRVRYKYSVL